MNQRQQDGAETKDGSGIRIIDLCSLCGLWGSCDIRKAGCVLKCGDFKRDFGAIREMELELAGSGYWRLFQAVVALDIGLLDEIPVDTLNAKRQSVGGYDGDWAWLAEVVA